MDSHRNNLAEFEDFLERHRLVTPEKARFYVFWVDRFLKYCKIDLPSRSLRLFLHTSRLWKRIPTLPTGKSNRRRTRFFYMPINISSRNLLSFRQMAPFNQNPWDRSTNEICLIGIKYSINCTKTCVFDIILPDGKILKDMDLQILATLE